MIDDNHDFEAGQGVQMPGRTTQRAHGVTVIHEGPTYQLLYARAASWRVEDTRTFRKSFIREERLREHGVLRLPGCF